MKTALAALLVVGILLMALWLAHRSCETCQKRWKEWKFRTGMKLLRGSARNIEGGQAA